jgi:hypothetical protein
MDLFGYWPLFTKSKFVSGHTCGMPYFMAKVLRLVRGQYLARNSGNYLVCYHKCLPKTHNNCLDCERKFDKEMKNTAITENSFTDIWLDISEYDQSVFFSTGSCGARVVRTARQNGYVCARTHVAPLAVVHLSHQSSPRSAAVGNT